MNPKTLIALFIKCNISNFKIYYYIVFKSKTINSPRQGWRGATVNVGVKKFRVTPV